MKFVNKFTVFDNIIGPGTSLARPITGSTTSQGIRWVCVNQLTPVVSCLKYPGLFLKADGQCLGLFVLVHSQDVPLQWSRHYKLLVPRTQQGKSVHGVLV